MTQARILARCSDCKRQYDVSKRPPGSSIRCRCSRVLKVPDVSAKGHNAAVVRCSACGGPRHGDETSCIYCKASFTLHEQDLHTICPSCFTRISARAKFCHSCGEPISVEQSIGREVELTCPACGPGYNLVSRTLGSEQTAILECSNCAGFWLSHAQFEHVVRAKQAEAIPGLSQTSTTKPSIRPQKGPMYRKCPECGDVMNRLNYGRQSGVIVDICPQHGVWFDHKELDAILQWVRAGGRAAATKKSRLDRAPRATAARSAITSEARTPTLGRAGSSLDDPLAWVTDVVHQLFRF